MLHLSPRSAPLRALLAAASIAAPASLPAHAVIVTTDLSAGTPEDPALRSALAALGRWGNNAAAVAVADGWVLTSRHQDRLDATPSRTLTFGDRTLRAVAAEAGGQELLRGDTDLRLVRVTELDGGVARFDATLRVSGSPVTAGTAVTLAGFGPGRGEAIDDGYRHAAVAGAANANPLRVGTNVVSEVGPLETEEGQTPGPFEGMAVLAAVFDDLPGTREASVGLGDSGGFWLVGDAVRGYEIAGITFGVDLREGDVNPATDRPALLLEAFFGQQLVATDATPFAARINAIPEPATAALLASGGLLLLGRRRRPAGRSA